MIALALVGAFVLGSIPFGWVLTRLAGLGDIRAIGSGSTGATNVLRTGRRDIAAATLLLDAGKGALAVWLADRAGSDLPPVAGALAVLGHCYSPWMGGRGGKGIATGLGVVAAVAWPAALVAGAVWMLTAWRTRISSAGAMAACAVAPFAVFAWAGWRPAAVVAVTTLLVVWRHRANIARLRAGTEPRIGQAV